MLSSPLLNTCLGFIGGRWCGSDSGETSAVTNPADGELLANVPRMGVAETVRAIDAAEQRIRTPVSCDERRNWLKSIADAIRSNRQEFGRIITLEHGKPWKEATAEADYAASFFEFYAKTLDQIQPRVLPDTPRDHSWHVYSRPAGVAALITPWNFPIAMLAKKLSAALAAGCSCVVKPSSKAPLATVALFGLLDQIGFPSGMVNLVLGPADVISERFCLDRRVRVISFTGSTEIGRLLMENASGQLKRLSLELGGNAPYIVFEDADLLLAADHLVQNKFRAAGQTCVCANRIYVQRSIRPAFVELIAERVAKLKVGNGLEEQVDIGPLIDRNAFAKVKSHLDDAIQKGAKPVVGRVDIQVPKEDFGCFFSPIVLTGIQPEMRCVTEETFGPLVPIADFDDERQVIDAANSTEYGLAAYVFTSDNERGNRIAAALQFGHVGLNTGTGPSSIAPFGGFKQSGFGREGGLEGLHDFVEYQTVAHPL